MRTTDRLGVLGVQEEVRLTRHDSNQTILPILFANAVDIRSLHDSECDLLDLVKLEFLGKIFLVEVVEGKSDHTPTLLVDLDDDVVLRDEISRVARTGLPGENSTHEQFAYQHAHLLVIFVCDTTIQFP